ncbi:hypothetical protein [Streptomyces sp. NPDC048720]|uniref:hypothetical protein n=1 Tax=Streptomyces sp. NPDC048720 TaxID=3365588 RepID=UPI00371106BC
MKLISQAWRSIRRNPVICGFAFAIAAQLAHDYLANQIDWTNICGYLATMAVGVFVREFVVPLSKHEETKELVSKAIVNLEAEKQAEISAMLDRFEGRKRD